MEEVSKEAERRRQIEQEGCQEEVKAQEAREEKGERGKEAARRGRGEKKLEECEEERKMRRGCEEEEKREELEEVGRTQKKDGVVDGGDTTTTAGNEGHVGGNRNGIQAEGDGHRGGSKKRRRRGGNPEERSRGGDGHDGGGKRQRRAIATETIRVQRRAAEDRRSKAQIDEVSRCEVGHHKKQSSDWNGPRCNQRRTGVSQLWCGARDASKQKREASMSLVFGECFGGRRWISANERPTWNLSGAGRGGGQEGDGELGGQGPDACRTNEGNAPKDVGGDGLSLRRLRRKRTRVGVVMA